MTNLSENSPFQQIKLKVDINIALILMSLLLLFVIQPQDYGVFDKNLNIYFTIIGTLNIFVFLYTSGHFFSSWVRYDVLFLVGYIIVHFQIPFLAGIGIEPEKPDFIWINKMVVNYATWISTIAVLLWMMGFLLYIKRANKTYDEHKEVYESEHTEINYRINTTILDIVLVTSFLLFMALAGTDLLRGKYTGGDTWSTEAGYAYLILDITLYLRIIALFVNYRGLIRLQNIMRIISENKMLIVIVILYTLIFFLSGDRGPIMRIGLVVLGAYSIYQGRISFQFFLVMAIAGAITFTVLSFGRSRDGLDDKMILSEGLKNMEMSETSFNPTNDLAYSNRILYTALNTVPDKFPYLYGTTMYYELAGIIPLGGTVYIALTDMPAMFKSSTSFFTIVGQGKFYDYGEGSEILGDIYINWGVIGVFILLFLLGYLIGLISFKSNISKSHTWVIVYLLLITSAIYLNRATLLSPMKLVIFGLIFDRILAKKEYDNNIEE